MVPPQVGGVLVTIVGSAGATVQTPWVGGAPSATWNASANSEPESPFCMRPVGTCNQLKIHAATVKELDTKFGPHDLSYSLLSLETAVWEQVSDKGLDTIFYVLDPQSGVMEELITRHSRFPISYVCNYVNKLKDPINAVHYDVFNVKNLVSARMFLLSSLSDELRQVIERKINNSTSAPEVWMYEYIVKEVQSDSTRRHQCIKKEIRSLTLAKFPLENITLFNSVMLEKFRELDNADVLEDDLLLTLYEAYMNASTEIFRSTFITSRRELDVFIKSVKNKDAAARAILSAAPGASTFTYRTIMEEAHQLYCDLIG